MCNACLWNRETLKSTKDCPCQKSVFAIFRLAGLALDIPAFELQAPINDCFAVRTNQKNFIGNVVMALYKLCRDALPSTTGVCEASIEQMKKNHARWAALNY